MRRSCIPNDTESDRRADLSFFGERPEKSKSPGSLPSARRTNAAAAFGSLIVTLSVVCFLDFSAVPQTLRPPDQWGSAQRASISVPVCCRRPCGRPCPYGGGLPVCKPPHASRWAAPRVNSAPTHPTGEPCIADGAALPTASVQA